MQKVERLPYPNGFRTHTHAFGVVNDSLWRSDKQKEKREQALFSLFGLPERIQNPYTQSQAIVVNDSHWHSDNSKSKRRGKAPLLLAYPNGFEPLTFRVGVWRAIQLCHGQILSCDLNILPHIFKKVNSKHSIFLWNRRKKITFALFFVGFFKNSPRKSLKAFDRRVE